MEERFEIINFEGLVSKIKRTNDALQNNARLVINRHVTAKAWLTGCYIVEYEQNGCDRAKYGEQLLQNLAKRLGKGYTHRTPKLFRLFYQTYQCLALPVKGFLEKTFPMGQSLMAQLESKDNQSVIIGQSAIAQFPTIIHSSSAQFNGVIEAGKLICKPMAGKNALKGQQAHSPGQSEATPWVI